MGRGRAPRNRMDRTPTLESVAADLADLRRVTGEEDLDLRARVRAVEERFSSLEEELRGRLESLEAAAGNGVAEDKTLTGEAGESGPAAPRARRAQKARRLTQGKQKAQKGARGDSRAVKPDSKRKSKSKERRSTG